MGCDFTYSHYREILGNALKAGYQISSFHNSSLADENKRALYIRHDVDGPLTKAAAMAKVEAEMGIRATYFVLANSPLYNLLEEQSLSLLQEITSLGHWLGLHVDLAVLSSSGVKSIDELTDKLFTAFRQLIPLMPVVSFHRPTPEVLDKKFSSFTSTYEPRFFSQIKYLSDSRGKWREGCPCEVLKEGRYPKLQLLMHPIWWSEPEQRDVIGLAEEMLEVRHKTCLRYLRTMEPFKSEIK